MVITGAFVSALVLGVATAFFVFRSAAPVRTTRSGGQPMALIAEDPATAPARPERRRWNSARPLLRDLDGDGEDDLIGQLDVTVDSRTRRHLAAFSGKDGRALWRSPVVPDGLGTQARLTLAGDHLLLAGDDGKVHAYQVAGGDKAWTLEVGERVELVCRLADGDRVRVITKDERARDVALASGAATEVSGKSRRQLWRGCDAIGNDDNNTYGQVVYDPFDRLPSVRGMYPGYFVKRGDTALISGGKAPGTGIPMVVLRQGKEVRWRAELPSSDALTSDMDEKILFFDSRVALATYSTHHSAGQARLVALAIEDGRRLWETPLVSGIGSLVFSSVLATQRRAVVVTWSYLASFDLETGKQVFTIGD
jgi:outer membrane protein assembly factor BamB